MVTVCRSDVSISRLFIYFFIYFFYLIIDLNPVKLLLVILISTQFAREVCFYFKKFGERAAEIPALAPRVLSECVQLAALTLGIR